MTRTATTNPAHIRHHGVMIDASYKGGTRRNPSTDIEYYVVEGGPGRFYTLDAAKEIAEYRARTVPWLVSRN